MTLREAIADAAARLRPITETPRLDAELLAAFAIGSDREDLLLRLLGEDVPHGYSHLIDRRANGEPVAYITGTRDFWTITLAVSPGVLIPRPDSETLIETALSHFNTKQPASILDLGTGSGALLLAALDQWRSATGVGIDISELAVAMARHNAEQLGMAERAEILLGNWGAGLDRQFDLILCNPPYVEENAQLPREVSAYEPAGALYAGNDGLAAYRLLAPQISRLLAPGGIAVFEIGWNQGQSVTRLFALEGLEPVLAKDLGGRDRCVAIRLP